MSSPRRHISVWKRLLLVFAVLFVAVVAMVGYDLYQLCITRFLNRMMLDDGSLIVGYLEAHSNSGQEVGTIYSQQQLQSAHVGFVPIDRLRQSVKIDWQVDVKHLQEFGAQ